jgi:methylmalonyl-CoA mutase
VRRALAIQLVIQKELGLAHTDNALQGAYAIEHLTELMERAVLEELDRLSERGGVLGAMELLYQRSKIQEESLRYESLKHSGELPIVGVNTFENPDPGLASQRPAELARSTEPEKRAQLEDLHAFHGRWAGESRDALQQLTASAQRGDNLFEALMHAVRYASLGQITDALFQVGGAYRRAM